MEEKEYKRRKDRKSYVFDDMIKLRKNIMSHAEKTGQLSEDDGRFLVKFDKATRVCNRCGKSAKRGLWHNRLFKTASGKTDPCGLEALCWDCQMELLRNKILK